MNTYLTSKREKEVQTTNCLFTLLFPFQAVLLNDSDLSLKSMQFSRQSEEISWAVELSIEYLFRQN